MHLHFIPINYFSYFQFYNIFYLLFHKYIILFQLFSNFIFIIVYLRHNNSIVFSCFDSISYNSRFIIYHRFIPQFHISYIIKYFFHTNTFYIDHLLPYSAFQFLQHQSYTFYNYLNAIRSHSSISKFHQPIILTNSQFPQHLLLSYKVLNTFVQPLHFLQPTFNHIFIQNHFTIKNISFRHNSFPTIYFYFIFNRLIYIFTPFFYIYNFITFLLLLNQVHNRTFYIQTNINSNQFINFFIKSLNFLQFNCSFTLINPSLFSIIFNDILFQFIIINNHIQYNTFYNYIYNHFLPNHFIIQHDSIFQSLKNNIQLITPIKFFNTLASIQFWNHDFSRSHIPIIYPFLIHKNFLITIHSNHFKTNINLFLKKHQHNLFLKKHQHNHHIFYIIQILLQFIHYYSDYEQSKTIY